MSTMPTTPDALKLAKLLRRCHGPMATVFEESAALLEQQHAALESLRSAPGCQCGDDDVCAIAKERDELQAEAIEQARLNGMGASREIALLARQNELLREVESLRAGRAVPAEVRERLFKLLNGASGDGLIINDVDAAELFFDLFPEHADPDEITAAPTPPQAEQAGKRDREQDRARFPDPDFNRWLDESITENGEFTAWHALSSTGDAYAGWSVRPDYCQKAERAGNGEIVAWVRECSDGTLEGPILDNDSRMSDTRRKFWTRLSSHPAQQPDDARDARRYRLIRRGQHWSVINGIGDVLRGDELDAATDAVITP